jgi:ferredoxin
VKVSVDPSRCAGHAQCAAICPEVFDSDEEGYAVVLAEGVVPEGAEDLARTAIGACPERAIAEVRE